MKNIIFYCTLAMLCMPVINVSAAEKSKLLIQIDAARTSIDAATPKVGDNKTAAGDLDQARTLLKQAEATYEKGRPLFGIGDLKPEVEQNVRHLIGLSELAVQLADIHLATARSESELGAIEKQLASVKAKVKLFEDRKAEMERLKTEAAKYQTAVKDMETLKAENDKLNAQLRTLTTERNELNKKNELLAVELAKFLPQNEKKPIDQVNQSTGNIDPVTAATNNLTAPAPKPQAPETTPPKQETESTPAAQVPASESNSTQTTDAIQPTTSTESPTPAETVPSSEPLPATDASVTPP